MRLTSFQSSDGDEISSLVPSPKSPPLRAGSGDETTRSRDQTTESCDYNVNVRHIQPMHIARMLTVRYGHAACTVHVDLDQSEPATQ